MASPKPSVVGGSSSDGPDYSCIEIPSKPPSEFSWRERRAELLQQIRDLGHPSMIHQGEMAERYDVSQQQISKDLDRLAEYVREDVVDRDHRALAVDAVVKRSIRGLLEEGEYRKAARTAMEFDDWLTEFHDLDQLAAEVEQLKDAHDT